MRIIFCLLLSFSTGCFARTYNLKGNATSFKIVMLLDSHNTTTGEDLSSFSLQWELRLCDIQQYSANKLTSQVSDTKDVVIIQGKNLFLTIIYYHYVLLTTLHVCCPASLSQNRLSMTHKKQISSTLRYASLCVYNEAVESIVSNIELSLYPALVLAIFGHSQLLLNVYLAL